MMHNSLFNFHSVFFRHPVYLIWADISNFNMSHVWLFPTLEAGVWKSDIFRQILKNVFIAIYSTIFFRDWKFEFLAKIPQNSTACRIFTVAWLPQ
jgi:hypothetical protein